MKKVLLVLFLCATLQAGAQDLKTSELSFSLGYMFEGEAYAWEFDEYESVGETLLIRLEYDHYFAAMAKRFGLGIYYTYANPWYGFNETVSQHEIGAVLKARISAGEKLLLKPGAYFGYRSYGGDAGTGLGINGSLAFEYQLKTVKPFLDLGIMSQPAGGNDATDVTYSPVFQVLVGVTF